MKNPWGSPVALFQLQTQTTLMAMEAGAVIWMRLLGMAGAWNVAPSENTRMISEKHRAFLQATQAASLAAMTGKDSAAAAIRPLRRKTRSNVHRLAKRGPKLT